MADQTQRKRGRPPKHEPEPEENGVDLLFGRLSRIEMKLDILIELTKHQSEIENILKRSRP